MDTLTTGSSGISYPSTNQSTNMLTDKEAGSIRLFGTDRDGDDRPAQRERERERDLYDVGDQPECMGAVATGMTASMRERLVEKLGLNVAPEEHLKYSTEVMEKQNSNGGTCSRGWVPPPASFIDNRIGGDASVGVRIEALMGVCMLPLLVFGLYNTAPMSPDIVADSVSGDGGSVIAAVLIPIGMLLTLGAVWTYTMFGNIRLPLHLSIAPKYPLARTLFSWDHNVSAKSGAVRLQGRTRVLFNATLTDTNTDNRAVRILLIHAAYVLVAGGGLLALCSTVRDLVVESTTSSAEWIQDISLYQAVAIGIMHIVGVMMTPLEVSKAGCVGARCQCARVMSFTHVMSILALVIVCAVQHLEDGPQAVAALLNACVHTIAIGDIFINVVSLLVGQYLVWNSFVSLA
ncbi:hypothetical protein KIPB_007950, partial [Kipferlia bialata]|eukprot:g7950.t1